MIPLQYIFQQYITSSVYNIYPPYLIKECKYNMDRTDNEYKTNKGVYVLYLSI